MADKKITKIEYFEMIKTIVELSGSDMADEMVAFIDTQIEQIVAKAEKAKVRAAEKKTEGDELRSVIQDVLTSDYQDIDSIMAQVDGEDITRAKISARLGQLVKAGIADKKQMKNDEGKKAMFYCLASVDAE